MDPSNLKNETKIKEKLNNHVKKRLQDNDEDKKPVKKPKMKKDKPRTTTEPEYSPQANQPQEDSGPSVSALHILLHTNEKDNNRKPDMLTSILNQKKKSLMQDPEVIQFLKNILDKNK
jgi:hypothetical protein